MMVQETMGRITKAKDDLMSLFDEIVSSLPSPLPEVTPPAALPQVVDGSGDKVVITSYDAAGQMEVDEEISQDLKEIFAARDLLRSIHGTSVSAIV